jgi:hypothetical protein
MKEIIVYPVFALCFIAFSALAGHAAMQSNNYRITTSVLSSGGTTLDSATFQMTTTMGQSSCIGLSSKRDYINYAGFWQPDKLEIKGRAMPWLPLLLLEE